MPKLIYTGIGRYEYRREVCDKLLEYFSTNPYRTGITVDKYSNESETRIANDLPLLGKFAVDELHVCQETFRAWADKYPEIAQAYNKAKDLQEYILITNSLLGLYNSRTAIFAMKNLLGWRDKIDSNVSGELSVTSLMGKISESNNGKDLISQRNDAIDNNAIDDAEEADEDNIN